MSKTETKRRKRAIKIGYLILSFFISFMMWISVVIYLDPEQTQVINDVSVEFSGERVILENRSLIIVEGRGVTRNITFRGNRSSLSKLNKDNVRLIVDVSAVSSKGPRSLAYKVEYPTELENKVFPISGNNPSIDIKTDQLVSANFEVKVVIDGPIAPNHMAEDAVVEPSWVTVSGPSELMESISCAEVTIVREVFDKSIEHETFSYSLKDVQSNSVESPLITPEQSSVVVSLPILMTKEVPLRLEFNDGGGATEKNALYEITPKTVTVSGSKSELDKLNFILLDTINLAQVTMPVTVSYPITLPNGIRSITGEQEASVSLELTGLKELRLEATNISVKNGNLPAGYRIAVITNSISVTIRGAPEIVDLITQENVAVIADLEGQNLSPGMMNVPAQVICPAYQKSQAGPIGGCTITIEVVQMRT